MLPSICGEGNCVSATITTTASSLSLDALRVRSALQIRWASTDLAVLETHPLTPGLRLPRQTVTINPVPSPQGFYKLGLGLAILPVLLALVAVTAGTMSLFIRRHAKLHGGGVAQEQSHRPNYKPLSFSMGTLVLLIAVAVTSIILLELSCHIIPHSDTSNPYLQYSFESNSSSSSTSPSTTTTAAAVTTTTTNTTNVLERRQELFSGTATLSMGLSCWVTTYVPMESSTSADW